MNKIATILIATFALFSCAKENIDGNNPTTKGVQVRFKTSDFTEVSSRAASETNIKDVTILQFKDGTLVQKEILENINFSSAITLEFLQGISAANLDENGKLVEDGKENLVYFIANAKAVTGAEVLLTKGSSTFDDLKALKFGTNNLSEVLPMTGQHYGGVAEGATTQIDVMLTRTVAKVNFALNTANFLDEKGAQPSVVINKIELYNAPKEITPYPCNNRPALPTNGGPGIWSDVMTPFPAYSTGSFEGYGVEKNNSATPLTNYVTYMPENARGSFTSIKNNKDKKPESINDDALNKGLTYILVDLDYTTASGVTKNATYKIYVGGDAAGDMNLLRNTQYNITTYLYGANEADTRITVTPIFDPEDGLDSGSLNIQQSANCYIINPASIPDKYTIQLSQARRGWNYIKSSENNDALLTTFDELIKTDNWEIVTLWRTWGMGDAAANITGKKAEGISFEQRPEASEKNYFATLTFPQGIQAGHNAVIALVNKSDQKIYWSWHLWFTDYNPDAAQQNQMNGQTHSYFGAAFQLGGAYLGKTMMDRNLGAMATGVSGAISQPATTEEAVKYYGLHYQFGRKDPFVGSSNGSATLVAIYGADGNPIADRSIAAGSSSNLANAVLNPMNFYTVASGNWTTPSEDLWNSTGGKSVFDPCPAGWRIPVGGATPANNPWAGFSNGNENSVAGSNYIGDYFKWTLANTSGSNIAGSAGALYSHTDTQAWYPATGNRNVSDGNNNFTGTIAFYWSSSPNGSASGVSLYFYNTNVNPSTTNNRAYGFPVRCIRE